MDLPAYNRVPTIKNAWFRYWVGRKPYYYGSTRSETRRLLINLVDHVFSPTASVPALELRNKPRLSTACLTCKAPSGALVDGHPLDTSLDPESRSVFEDTVYKIFDSVAQDPEMQTVLSGVEIHAVREPSSVIPVRIFATKAGEETTTALCDMLAAHSERLTGSRVRFERFTGKWGALPGVLSSPKGTVREHLSRGVFLWHLIDGEFSRPTSPPSPSEASCEYLQFLRNIIELPLKIKRPRLVHNWNIRKKKRVNGLSYEVFRYDGKTRTYGGHYKDLGKAWERKDALNRILECSKEASL
jgi:hypothetical protein